MPTPLTEQIRSLANDVDDVAAGPRPLPGPMALPRRGRALRGFFAAACVALIAGVIAVAVAGERRSGEPPEPAVAAQTSTSTNPDGTLDPDLQTQIDSALATATPGAATFGVPIGDPWQGQILTSDGGVDVYLSRAVGDARDGEGICFSSGCYGAGWSDEVATPRLTGGSRDPILMTPDDSGEPMTSDPVIRVFWLLPEGTTQVAFAWSDGVTTTAEAIQPFGPGTPTITAAVVPPGATSGTLSSGGTSVDFEIPHMRSAQELMADMES